MERKRDQPLFRKVTIYVLKGSIALLAFAGLLFPLQVESQGGITVVNSCSTYGDIPNDLVSKYLLYVVSKGEFRELWISQAICCPAYTGLHIPRRATSLALSPDSSKLVYMATWESDEISNESEVQITVIDLATGLENTILEENSNNVDIIDLHWIDDSHLGFLDYTRQQNITISLDGQRQLFSWSPLSLSNSIDFLYINFNPQLTDVAYLTLEAEEYILRIRNLSDNGVLVEVPNPSYPNVLHNAIWSPDGSQFIVLDRNYNWLSLSTADGIPRQITDLGNIFDLREPTFSPDATKIAFAAVQQPSSRPNVSPVLAILNDTELLTTCQYGLLDMNPRGWNSDGRYFAILIFNQNGQHLYVLDTDNNMLFDFDFQTLGEFDYSVEILGWIESYKLLRLQTDLDTPMEPF